MQEAVINLQTFPLSYLDPAKMQEAVKGVRGTADNLSPTAKGGATAKTPKAQSQVEETPFMPTEVQQITDPRQLQNAGVAGSKMSKEMQFKKFDGVGNIKEVH